jgi:putative membrane protein
MANEVTLPPASLGEARFVDDPPFAASIARRVATGLVGIVVLVIAVLGLRDPLASMSSYTAALMALNQVAPPLLLLAFRPCRALKPSRGGLIARLVLDPWPATLSFMFVSVAVSFPGILNPTLANALYAAPLGAIEFSVGLLFWAQFLRPTRRIRRDLVAGFVIWVGTIPMTVVAVVWMLSPNVLYTPYLDIICRWDIPPLVDQKWAGLVMFVAGVPLQMVGSWLLLEASGDAP